MKTLCLLGYGNPENPEYPECTDCTYAILLLTHRKKQTNENENLSLNSRRISRGCGCSRDLRHGRPAGRIVRLHRNDLGADHAILNLVCTNESGFAVSSCAFGALLFVSLNK